MDFYGIISINKLGQNLNQFIFNLLLAILLIIVGIFLGKLVKYLIRRFFEKIKADKAVKWSILELILTIIKWSIYLLFIYLALGTLNVPTLTGWLEKALLPIPALVGALILVVVGFIIASYLKEVIEETEVEGKDALAKAVFYFVWYVFLVYAVKTALISQEVNIVNTLIMVLTVIIAIAISYTEAKKAVAKYER